MTNVYFRFIFDVATETSSHSHQWLAELWLLNVKWAIYKLTNNILLVGKQVALGWSNRWYKEGPLLRNWFAVVKRGMSCCFCVCKDGGMQILRVIFLHSDSLVFMNDNFVLAGIMDDNSCRFIFILPTFSEHNDSISLYLSPVFYGTFCCPK